MGGLPLKIIALIYPLMLFNSMAASIANCFLPKLVKDFGASEVNAGHDVGLIRSATFAGRTFFLIFWGYISDNIGRKIPLAITSYGLAFSSLVFGVSSNFYYALVTRFIQGCFMVLNILCKSILADTCDETNFTQSLSILMSAKCLGRVLADVLGGFLSFPVQQFPNTFRKGGILEKNPILLLMLILSSGIMVANTLMIKFLPSDYKNHMMSYSRIKNKKTEAENEIETIIVGSENEKGQDDINLKLRNDEISSLLRDMKTRSVTALCSLFSRICRVKILQALKTKECLIGCILYACYSMTGGGTYPLFASTAKTLNGLGFNPAKVGLTLSIAFILLFLFQLLLQSRICNFLGPRKSIVLSILEFAVLYPLLPLIAEIHNDYTEFVLACIWLFLVRAHKEVGRLAVNVFIKKSVTSDLIGSAMGLAQAANSAGKMISPTIFGWMYAWSLKNVQDETMGFPFNQYFVFFVKSLWAVFLVILSFFVPEKTDTNKC